MAVKAGRPCGVPTNPKVGNEPLFAFDHLATVHTASLVERCEPKLSYHVRYLRVINAAREIRVERG